MIDHIIKTTDENTTKSRLRQKRYYNRHSKTGGQADEDVRYCNICDQCWEYRRKGNGNKEGKVLHYSDFVTYGKERVICPLCVDKRHHCDLCETDRSDITKQDGIWSCTECDINYPREEEDE